MSAIPAARPYGAALVGRGGTLPRLPKISGKNMSAEASQLQQDMSYRAKLENFVVAYDPKQSPRQPGEYSQAQRGFYSSEGTADTERTAAVVRFACDYGSRAGGKQLPDKLSSPKSTSSSLCGTEQVLGIR